MKKLNDFIENDSNMRMAMRILIKEGHWSAPNCSQVTRYLDSKGYDGLNFVKVCGKKFGFMDDFMMNLSDMAFNQTELDELEIELDKMVTHRNAENSKDYFGMV